jgi:hypothetical protein
MASQFPVDLSLVAVVESVEAAIAESEGGESAAADSGYGELVAPDVVMAVAKALLGDYVKVPPAAVLTRAPLQDNRNNQDGPLTAALLRMAAGEFVNHSCNEFDLTAVMPDVVRRRALMHRVMKWNGTPSEFDPDGDYRFADDWVLMRYLASELDGARPDIETDTSRDGDPPVAPSAPSSVVYPALCRRLAAECSEDDVRPRLMRAVELAVDDALGEAIRFLRERVGGWQPLADALGIKADNLAEVVRQHNGITLFIGPEARRAGIASGRTALRHALRLTMPEIAAQLTAAANLGEQLATGSECETPWIEDTRDTVLAERPGSAASVAEMKIIRDRIFVELATVGIRATGCTSPLWTAVERGILGDARPSTVTWHAFECPGCPRGAVLDVRADGEGLLSVAPRCPAGCDQVMEFRGSWPDDGSSYGGGHRKG